MTLPVNESSSLPAPSTPTRLRPNPTSASLPTNNVPSCCRSASACSGAKVIPVASVSVSTDRPHSPWKCPVCGAIVPASNGSQQLDSCSVHRHSRGTPDEAQLHPRNLLVPAHAYSPVSHMARRRSQAALSRPRLNGACQRYPTGKVDLAVLQATCGIRRVGPDPVKAP